jgi:hypothetical protein
MIGFLLAAAHNTTCLNYTYSYSAIAIQHIQQSRFTLMHTESISSSLHLRLLTPGTLNATVDTHSLHSIITLCNHTMLLWPIIVDSLNTSRLHYWLPHCLGVLRTLTGIAYNSNTLTLVYCRNYTAYYTDCIQLGWLTYILLRALWADPPKTPLATPVLLSRHVHVITSQASHWSDTCYPATCYKHLSYDVTCCVTTWPLFRNALSKFVTILM